MTAENAVDVETWQEMIERRVAESRAVQGLALFVEDDIALDLVAAAIWPRSSPLTAAPAQQ